jgi:hypothetical protein
MSHAMFAHARLHAVMQNCGIYFAVEMKKKYEQLWQS